MSDFNSFISSLSDEQKSALLKMLTTENKNTESKPAKPKQQKTEQTSESTESARVNSDFTMKRAETTTNNGRREPVRARKNEWVDEGEFRDIETNYGEKTPRNRKPQKKVDVECSVCGRSFKTDPRYVYGEYHRCSRCVGR